MHILDIFQAHPTTFSFEFFPPKTDAASEELFANIAQLQALQPSFVSVTYGAGGSTRERTHDLIVRIQRETSLTAVSHLTCVCHRPGRARRRSSPVTPPRASRTSWRWAATRPANARLRPWRSDAFRYADGLVAFISAWPNAPDPRGFGVGVAGFPEGHPGTPNRLKEMDYLKRKVDTGADYICTQLFFCNDDFYDFRERCEWAGMNVPIVAGIMPITSQAGHGPDGRARPGRPVPRAAARAPSTDAATIPRPSPRWASTGRPSSAATCSTTTSAASTSIPSIAPTPPGESTRTSASRTPSPSASADRAERTGRDIGRS